jgi:hypothetical protein
MLSTARRIANPAERGEKELYHIGASLKDLGKRWFAFSKLNEFLSVVLKRLKYT